MTRTSLRYSMPKDDRGLLHGQARKKSDTSNNTERLSTMAKVQILKAHMNEKYEVAKMKTLRNDGCYSMPKGHRNIDLTKFSSQHS